MDELKRYFTSDALIRVKNDFSNLLGSKNITHGRLYFAIRDQYFNLYYRGNNLAKVEIQKGGKYKVTIQKDFFEGTVGDSDEYYTKKSSPKSTNEINIWLDDSCPPKHFFKVNNIDSICSRIRKRDFSEELALEQAIISDNMNREDIIIIDRQVQKPRTRQKMDLLSLVQINQNKYSFCINEVKIGKNDELGGKVADQLNDYIQLIEKRFSEYKTCYEKQYKQKKELSLLNGVPYDEIKIEQPVLGKVLVGGYIPLANEYIEKLKKTEFKWSIQKFDYKLK